MKVLITGGAGYIGTELCYSLSTLDIIKEIIIYDNFSRANFNLFIGIQKIANNKVRLVEGDLLDSRKLKKVVAEVDVIFHLAAKVTTPFADQNPHLFEQVNHWGTAELVYAIESTSLEKFVFLSSVSVYGSTNAEVDVDSPINPKTFYGISKMRGEEHVMRLFPKMQSYIVRCGNVYGYSKSMRFDAVINKFMFDANFKGRITINGDGNQYRSFIHIDKVTSALTNILTNDLKSNKFDLVDRTISVNELVDTLREIYPELETLYVNQHLTLRDLKVKSNETMNQLITTPKADLKEELLEFKKAFSFA